MSNNSKIDICNMALGQLGNYGTINDIDTPTTEKEKTFSLWYDVSREALLKMVKPNFALHRRVLAKLSETPAFGYANVYEYPSDFLHILGIGNIEDKANTYTIEGNRLYTDEQYLEGLPLRGVLNFTDVSLMPSDFKILLSVYLAANTAQTITQDASKTKQMLDIFTYNLGAVAGMQAQENMPIRISRSRIEIARAIGDVSGAGKK